MSLDAAGFITVIVNALFLSMLIVAFVVDMEHFIIPNEVSIVGVALGILRDIGLLAVGSSNIVRIPIAWKKGGDKINHLSAFPGSTG